MARGVLDADRNCLKILKELAFGCLSMGILQYSFSSIHEISAPVSYKTLFLPLQMSAFTKTLPILCHPKIQHTKQLNNVRMVFRNRGFSLFCICRCEHRALITLFSSLKNSIQIYVVRLLDHHHPPHLLDCRTPCRLGLFLVDKPFWPWPEFSSCSLIDNGPLTYISDFEHCSCYNVLPVNLWPALNWNGAFPWHAQTALIISNTSCSSSSESPSSPSMLETVVLLTFLSCTITSICWAKLTDSWIQVGPVSSTFTRISSLNPPMYTMFIISSCMAMMPPSRSSSPWACVSPCRSAGHVRTWAGFAWYESLNTSDTWL